jgi:hypothetical protein
MKGGYLLSSRSSYSDNAVLTEYFKQALDFGVDYFTVTQAFRTGNQLRVTSSTFKKKRRARSSNLQAAKIVR